MNNLRFYEEVKTPPQNALKEIKGGRLRGMTDINPMWRIKKLTELFGPCGIGWYYEQTDKQQYPVGPEVIVTVDINLYIKDGDSWSKPIQGTGGSKMVVIEERGPHYNDECFKMATTDALSVACKALGVGADIYWQSDKTKYDSVKAESNNEPKTEPKESVPIKQNDTILNEFGGTEIKNEFICHDCNGKMTEKVYNFSLKKYGEPVCMRCQTERNAPKQIEEPF